MGQISKYKGGSNFESKEFSEKYEIIDPILDNTNNEIKAEDIRNAVYTLWKRTEKDDTLKFESENPVPKSIGGINKGRTFSEGISYNDLFNELLYPYLEPEVNMIINNDKFEYGDPRGIGNIFETSLILNWEVTKKSNKITYIKLTGPFLNEEIIPNGNNQSGNKKVRGTHPTNTDNNVTTNTFTIQVKDEKNTVEKNVGIKFFNKIYWGNIDKDNTSVNNNFILNLSSELKSSKEKIYDNINGNGNNLIFAFPSTMGKNPKFIINGLVSTSFTNVKTEWEFENQFGFKSNYEVWVSDTQQNSPIDKFKIE